MITLNYNKNYSTDGAFYRRQIKLSKKDIQPFIEYLENEIKEINEKIGITDYECKVKYYGNEFLEQYYNNEKLIFPTLTISRMLATFLVWNDFYKNKERLLNAVFNYNTSIKIY